MSGQVPTTHIHISEREPDGTWEDCTWDSGLEFYRDAIDASKPATHLEAERLRAASGEPSTGGSNLDDFRLGVKTRYGRYLPLAISNKNILTALKPGMCAVVQGSMSVFGPTHPLSKWDRNFDGGHAIYLAHTPGGVLLWCDPLAPTSADVPVVVSATEVTKYVNAFAGKAIVARALKWPDLTQQENSMPALVTYGPGSTANIKPASNVRAGYLKTSTLLRTTTVNEPVTLVGTVFGDIDSANGSNIWYTWWKNGRWEYTAKDNIIDIKPLASAPDDGYTKATQDAAVAAAFVRHQAIAVIEAKAAAAKSAAMVTAAIAIERERIATAEANRIRNIK